MMEGKHAEIRASRDLMLKQARERRELEGHPELPLRTTPIPYGVSLFCPRKRRLSVDNSLVR